MHPINIIMIYYRDKKKKTMKRLHVLEADIITIRKKIDLMSQAQRMHFLHDVFQMNAIALVSVINHYYINGWYTINTKKSQQIGLPCDNVWMNGLFNQITHSKVGGACSVMVIFVGN